MELNKNCPFSGKACNTNCALVVVNKHENFYAKKCNYTYTCGLMSNGNMTRFTKEMEVVK